jgi:hypothetical protein
VPHSGKFRGRFGGSAEAMEDAAQLAGVRAEKIEGIVPGIPLVDDHIASEFDREIKLHFESFGLGAFIAPSAMSACMASAVPACRAVKTLSSLPPANSRLGRWW